MADNFKSLLEQYLNFLNSPVFKELDKRLMKVESNNTSDDNTLLTTQQFIATILNQLDFLSDSSYQKVRKALLENSSRIKSMIELHQITKTKLNEILSRSNIKVWNIFSFLKYESGEELLILQLLDLIEDYCSKMNDN